MKLSSGPANSTRSNAFHHIPFLNISKALNRRVTSRHPVTILTVKLFVQAVFKGMTDVQWNVCLLLLRLLNAVDMLLQILPDDLALPFSLLSILGAFLQLFIASVLFPTF